MAKQIIRAYLNQYFGQDIENITPYPFKVAMKDDVLIAALGSTNESSIASLSTPIEKQTQYITRGVSLLWSSPYLVLRFFRKMILFFADQVSLSIDLADKENAEEKDTMELSSPFCQFIKGLVNVIFFIPEVICYMFSRIGDLILGPIVRFAVTTFTKKENISPQPQKNSAVTSPSNTDGFIPKVEAPSSTMNISQKITDEHHSKMSNETKVKLMNELKLNRDFLAKEAALEKNKKDKNIDILAIETLLTNLEIRQKQQSAKIEAAYQKQAEVKTRVLQIERMQLQSDLDSLTSILKSLSAYAELYGRALVIAGQINDKIRLLESTEHPVEQVHKSPKLGGSL